MNSYKCLRKQEFSDGELKLVPIRNIDRFDIMKWRNEQMYHLRQKELLTKELQNHYFKTVVASLFIQQEPNQILFSLLEGEKCIGYGGLVHINWADRNAEISFIMETELESSRFSIIWKSYLSLLEQCAFQEIKLHKLYTYAYDFRTNLFPVLESSDYVLDATLKEHYLFENNYIDIIIHQKINNL